MTIIPSNRKRSWTDDQLCQAVEQSYSVAQVLRKLNLAISGGSYVSIQNNISRLSLDTTHFGGKQGKNRYGKNKDLTLDEILTIDSSLPSSHIRKIVLRQNLKQNLCEECGIDNWNGKPITIQVHHKNYARNDHRIQNLQMLCPNCHSQK